MKPFYTSGWFRWFAGLLAVFIFWQSVFVNHNKDFDIFIEASRWMWRGEVPYDIHLLPEIAGLKYFYSPFFAALLYPLKDAPQVVYNLVWISFNYFLIYQIFRRLPAFFPGTVPAGHMTHLLVILSVVAVFRFLHDNLGLGQMTIFLVWASMEVLHLALKGKNLLAGLLLALVINIKLIPVALLFYFLYKGYFRLFGFTLVFGILMVYIPALVWGWEFNTVLHQAWLKTLTGTSVDSIVLDKNRPGISSLIPSLIMDQPIEFGIKRNFASFDAWRVQFFTNVVRGFFVLLGILLISAPLKKHRSKLSAFYDLAIVCMLTPLVFPHQGKYALLYTLPAYAICLFFLINKPKPVHRGAGAEVFWLVLVSFILVTLTTDGLITRKGSDMAEYLHLLTYGVFTLLAAMWRVKRRLPLSAETIQSR